MLDAAPALPAYGQLSAPTVQCIAATARRYEVPELLLHAIVRKEGGRTGGWSANRNGSYDLGLAQINTSWLPHFARYGVRLEHLVYDDCANVQASAYILKDNWQRLGHDWFRAIVAYNIGPHQWTTARYAIGYRYARDVVAYWWGFQRWVTQHNPVAAAR